MISKERLLAVPNLKLAGKIDKMNSGQLAGYVGLLNSFIDAFPGNAASLRSNLKKKAYGAVSLELTNICSVLERIHADTLASECRKTINSLKNAESGNADHSAMETSIENFIQSVSSLSIDIQMASRENKASAPAPKSQPKNRNQPVILAVDNAIMFLNILKRLMKDAPYNLECMTSCDAALEYLQNNNPDLILLDVEMPDMDGYELAKKIKSSGQKAPIIFITANSAREYVDKAMDVGAVGLLMKPLRINQLLSKIKEFI